MEITTAELMTIVAKVQAGEHTVEEALATVPPERREGLSQIISIVVVGADGQLEAIEPIDYSGCRKRC